MKPKNILELRRQRLDLVEEARELITEIDECKDDKRAGELSKQHEKVMRSIDRVDLDLDEARSEAETINASRRPMNDVRVPGFLTGKPAWRDAKGDPIRVLEANESFAEERHDLGIGFGDFIRAAVHGARNEQEKRALSLGTPSEGGYTVPAPLAREFIDKLRAETCAIRAGARTIPMDSASLSIARLDTDPTVSWRAENSLIDDSDPSFSRLLLEAKACAGIVKVSWELLRDSVNANEMLNNAFAQVMGRELDRVALWNDGSDDGPVGAAAVAGINEVSMGTDGAQLSNYDKLIDAIYEMKVDNAADPTAKIMHPRTAASLAKLKDGQNNPLSVPEMVASVPTLQTTSAPIDETQGTADEASSILFGNYRELFIGIRDQVSITVLRERYADYGQVGFLVWMRADVQLAHKASFCRLKGILA